MPVTDFKKIAAESVIGATSLPAHWAVSKRRCWEKSFMKMPVADFKKIAAESVIGATSLPAHWAGSKRRCWEKGVRDVAGKQGLLPYPGDAYILNLHGQYAIDLVTTTDNYVLTFYNSYTLTERRAFQLVSRAVDKSTGDLSNFFTNLTEAQIRRGQIENFLQNEIHPNILERYNATKLKRSNNQYTMSNPSDIVYTGHHLGMHAELRALSDLAGKRFGDNYIDPVIFDDWLINKVVIYNRNITRQSFSVTNYIMMPCADCFYLTDLANYIK